MPTAPCIAVVGPANAGKTTLLHQLDEKLQAKLDSMLVIKGNPDGTGRYLYHSPDLRHDPEFKKSVKGRWGAGTIERICEWITHGRRNLSLALLDFGGRHDEQTAAGNTLMLRACSHYLLVSRREDEPGAAFWDQVCRNHGLTRIGHLHSIPYGDRPAVLRQNGAFEATFCVDVQPGDPINDPVLDPLVGALLQLSCPSDAMPYVNLHRPQDWQFDQIADVAGQADKIGELARKTGVVVLGGKAPIWAYLAGLRSALNANEHTRVFFFDPQQPESLVEIPREHMPSDAFPKDLLAPEWAEEGGRSVLHLNVTSPDQFIPPQAAQNLHAAPLPPPPPSKHVGLSGRRPRWLFGTYARWLLGQGVTTLGSWDGRKHGYVDVWT